MKNQLLAILLIVFSFTFFEASGSHIVGGEVTYKFLKDTTVRGGPAHKYEVSLVIYEDCLNGLPGAISEDNPAFLAVFDALTRARVQLDTDINYDNQVEVPANFSNSCITKVPQICLVKKVFKKIYYLAPNAGGYVVTYQRCCRNNGIMNILSPGDNGSTYFCTIPGPITNNSAVFKNYPPQIICLNNPLYYDHSATDADGDSLSYEFCNALLGGSQSVVKPSLEITPPPYDTVQFLAPFSSHQPMTGFPPIVIDPITGIVTGTPNRVGRYLVTVCCNEWRHGVIINTTKREFQFVVTECSKVVVADIPQYSTDPNTYIVDCQDYTINFVNTSTGGFSYHWDFGVPGNSDTSNAFQPTYVYPDTGTFTVKLRVNPGSTCPDSISRFVKVYPRFYANFAESGRQCPGGPIQFTDQSAATIKPIVFWQWNFGDGDSATEQNPVHTYQNPGTYNVILISGNIKSCRDTAVRKIIIDNFHAFAGKDTVIVKGEHVFFNATGGIYYNWIPSANLSDSTIYNPIGYYPDTGRYNYVVHVQSDYGCSGDDTIMVRVINHAEFFIPTAFSPNGDGLNDIFRPVAVGYSALKYFRVFNRWGEMVYDNNNLEGGWDGTYKGKSADMGVYFWEIRFTDRFGTDDFLKGDVTLVR